MSVSFGGNFLLKRIESGIHLSAFYLFSLTSVYVSALLPEKESKHSSKEKKKKKKKSKEVKILFLKLQTIGRNMSTKQYVN